MNIFNKVYRFGSPCDQFYGYLVFKENNSIYGYRHINEHRWEIDSDSLYFLSQENIKTSIFQNNASTILYGHTYGTLNPLCLIPIVDTSDIVHNNKPHKIFINTIPKSGTYFLEKAINAVGYTPSRLHLSSYWFDDYRNLDDSEIHKKPELVRIGCPADIVISALPKGSIAVGHVENKDLLNNISEQSDVIFLNIVRDLRDILVSLYNFKLEKVSPKTPEDNLWRKIQENDRFLAFLSFYADKDLFHIKQMAQTIAESNSFHILKYEELELGYINSDVADYLKKYDENLSKDIHLSALKNKRKESPTLSKKRAHWQDYWNDNIQQFFTDFGFQQLNIKFGYK